jgi:cellulose synthase (UDP-forming)
LVAVTPITVEAQFALAATILCALVALRLVKLNTHYRYIYIGLSLVIVVRYFAWRFLSTIPPADSLLNFIPAVILLGAEVYCLIMLLTSLFVILDPIERETVAFSDREAPTVDVLVPSANENEELLAVTLSAALEMDYPKSKLNVYLLDDGGTDQRIQTTDLIAADAARKRRENLQKLCADLGAHYVTRTKNEMAKAGNLNNGLTVSSAELVAVFDADHAPSREFLRETVGPFLRDPRMFLVQTPHFFLNPDPLEKNLKTFGSMPSENEMFYSLIQRGLDRWNAAFFCGSAALLRREAIEEVGGFSGASITEDCETSLELHARGWNSVFVDKPMIAGLQPDTFEAFVGQRTRWSQGMLQLLLLKNPLFMRGLTMAQRVSYLSNILYWLFPVARMIFLLAPMCFIFFDMKIYVANRQEFFAYTVPYMIAAVMLQNHNFGRLRWPWMSELYEYVQSLYLIGPVLSVFANPRKPAFRVTAKGQTLESDGLSSLAKPQFVLFFLVAISFAVLGYRYLHEPTDRDLIAVVGMWTGLNFILTTIGLGVVSEIRERRSTPRRQLARQGSVRWKDGRLTNVLIDDASTRGAAMRFAVEDTAILQIGDEGLLGLAQPWNGYEVVSAPFVVRSRGRSGAHTAIGVEFNGPLAGRAKLAAALMFSDLTELRAERARRNVDKGVIVGSLMMVGWAFREGLRGIGYLSRGESTPGTAVKRQGAPASSSIRKV